MVTACKAGFDGVAAGIGVDDKRFRPITLDVKPCDKTNPRVVIFIKPAII